MDTTPVSDFNLPKHLAIIMDGNGRWAVGRGHNRFFGHIRGARTAKNIIEISSRLGIKHLTLFAFSTENWFRPIDEIEFLMKLLIRQLKREKEHLIKNNIRFQSIGDLSRLPPTVIKTVKETIEETAHCTGMNLVFALSYGGRQEITNAVRNIAGQIKDGKIDPSEIDEDMISKNLASSFLPDPDLIIRTSGEQRISNFFLWQASYSELYLIDKLWPDFSEPDLIEALDFYSGRTRRYGRIKSRFDNTSEQPSRH